MFEFGLLPKALQRYNYFLKYAREVGAFLLFFVGCLWKPAVGLPIMVLLWSGQSPDFRSLISRSSLAHRSLISRSSVAHLSVISRSSLGYCMFIFCLSSVSDRYLSGRRCDRLATNEDRIVYCKNYDAEGILTGFLAVSAEQWFSILVT